MNLHLLNLPGADPIQDIVAASKPYLVGRTHPVVVYLPPTLSPKYVAITRTAFDDLAELVVLDLTKPIALTAIESTLGQANVLFIPGGMVRGKI